MNKNIYLAWKNHVLLCVLLLGGLISQAFAQRAFDRPNNEINLRGSGAINSMQSIAVLPDGSVIAGGFFSTFDGVSRTSIVKINSTGAVNATFNPLLQTSFQPVSVSKVLVDSGGNILINGSFTSVNGIARNNFAKLLSSGALDNAWNTDQSGSMLFIGNGGPGNPTQFIYLASNGTITRIRLDNGQLDSSFVPPASLFNISNAAQDSQGRIYIARLSNTSGGYLLRLLPTGALDTTWTPNVNGPVHGLLIDPRLDGQSYFTGRFTQAGGMANNGFVRLNASGTADTTWNPPSALYPIEELAFEASSNFIYAANGSMNRYSTFGSGAPDSTWSFFSGFGDCQSGDLTRPSLAVSNNTLWISGPASTIGTRAMSRISSSTGAIQNEYIAVGAFALPISNISKESDGFYLSVYCSVYKFNDSGVIDMTRGTPGTVLNLASDNSQNIVYETSSFRYRQGETRSFGSMNWQSGTPGLRIIGQTFSTSGLGMLGNAIFICCDFNNINGIQKRFISSMAIDPAWTNAPASRFIVNSFGVYTWDSISITRRNIITGAVDFFIPVSGVTHVVIGADGGGYGLGSTLIYNEAFQRNKIIKFNSSGAVDMSYATFPAVSSAGPFRGALANDGSLFVAGDMASTSRQGWITKLRPDGQIDPIWAPRSLGSSGANSTNGSIYQMLIHDNRLVVLGLFNFANTLSRPDLVAFPTSVFPTTTQIISHTPEPSAVNQPYQVSVNVSSPNGIPDELVTISDGTGATCNATLSNGMASCTLISLSSGPKTLTATYRTTTSYAGSVATTTHNVIVPAVTTTLITSDQPDPSAIDTPYTVAVSVSSAAGTPSGVVAVSDGSVSCNATLSNGIGSCQLASTTAGNKTLTASYPESAQFGTSSDTEPHQVTGPITPVIELRINGSTTPPAVNPGRMGLALQFDFIGGNPASCQASGTAGTTWPVTTFSGNILSGSQTFFVRSSASGTQSLVLTCNFTGFANPISATINLPISGSAVSGNVSLGSISAASVLPNGVYRYFVPVSVVSVPSPVAFISQQPSSGIATITQMTSSLLTLDFTFSAGQLANRSLQTLRIAGNGTQGDEFPYVLVIPEPGPLFVNGFEGSAPVQPNAPSYAVRLSVSGDGRYSVYSSTANNLVANDTNGVADIFVYDAINRSTRRISIAGGNQGNGGSTDAVISQDGRYVAFQSTATNLVAGDTNGVSDIFVFDQQNNTVRRVSVDSTGLQANQPCTTPALSADGNLVVFSSAASNLVSGDGNGVEDVFSSSITTGNITRISLSNGGQSGNAASLCPCATSADGSVIAFQSDASNLVSVDTNNSTDIFVRHTINNTTLRASTNSAGAEGVGESIMPSVSGDGRYIVFESLVPSLISGDTNGLRDIFRKDIQTGSTLRVSVRNDGSQITTGDSAAASISSNGDAIGFFSRGTDLVPGDTNGLRDTFMRTLSTGTTIRTSIGTGGTQSNGVSVGYISADASNVLFVSAGSNLVPNDTNGFDDVFFRNLQTGETVRASIGTGN